MTAGQINIWRADVRRATVLAVRERAAFSAYRYEAEQRSRALGQVLRAMFIAKIDGDEFSRYPRR